MERVAKVVIVDDQDYYLVVRRDNHPTFGYDPDLPGGMVDDHESLLDAAVREVNEEIGLIIDPGNFTEIYSGNEYSAHGTQYTLYFAQLDNRPPIKLSWEHDQYSWLSRDDFLRQALSANDNYMHMAHDVITQIMTASNISKL